MSVQSFKAVASIVWEGGPKISIVLGLDHHYACLDWNILTETGCIVTESHFPLFCEDPVSHPVFIQTKKSHWFQAVWHPNSMRCKFITSLSLPPCNIMTGL